MTRELPPHGTPERFRLEQRAGRRPSLEDYEANATRVREAYWADPERARELTRERGRRFRERQRAARQANVDTWVQSVVAAPSNILDHQDGA